MTGLGFVVAVLGLLLAARSAQLLAGRGRPKRGPQPAFVVAGPYMRVRNPLFAGVVLGGVGLTIAFWSPPAAVVTATVAVGAHLWVTRVEEPRLRRRFGHAYEAYLESVPRWIPRRSAPTAE